MSHDHVYEAAQLRATAVTARVLVVGSLNVDYILHADHEPEDEGAVVLRSITRTVGGHAGNCAAALASLGVSVSLLGSIGADADGELILGDLIPRGIDVSLVRRYDQAPTGTAFIPVFGDKHYLMLGRGANELLTAAEVSVALAHEFDAVMLFDPSHEVILEVTRLRAAQASWPLLCWTPGLNAGDPITARVARQVDVLLLNRDEHRQVAAQLPGLTAGGQGPEIILTLGESGSLLRDGDRDDREWRAPALDVSVVDPTGAGDAFSATYLLAKLAGLSPRRRLELGNVAGALAISATGARACLATVSDLVGLARGPSLSNPRET
jgi:ribokinase